MLTATVARGNVTTNHRLGQSYCIWQAARKRFLLPHAGAHFWSRFKHELKARQDYAPQAFTRGIYAI
jgi:hypothetical protein